MNVNPGDIIAARVRVPGCSTCEWKDSFEFRPSDCLNCNEGWHEWKPAICLARTKDNRYKVAVIDQKRLECFNYVGIADIRPVFEMFDSWNELERYGFRTACAMKEE